MPSILDMPLQYGDSLLSRPLGGMTPSPEAMALADRAATSDVGRGFRSAVHSGLGGMKSALALAMENMGAQGTQDMYDSAAQDMQNAAFMAPDVQQLNQITGPYDALRYGLGAAGTMGAFMPLGIAGGLGGRAALAGTGLGRALGPHAAASLGATAAFAPSMVGGENLAMLGDDKYRGDLSDRTSRALGIGSAQALAGSLVPAGMASRLPTRGFGPTLATNAIGNAAGMGAMDVLSQMNRMDYDPTAKFESEPVWNAAVSGAVGGLPFVLPHAALAGLGKPIAGGVGAARRALEQADIPKTMGEARERLGAAGEAIKGAAGDFKEAYDTHGAAGLVDEATRKLSAGMDAAEPTVREAAEQVKAKGQELAEKAQGKVDQWQAEREVRAPVQKNLDAYKRAAETGKVDGSMRQDIETIWSAMESAGFKLNAPKQQELAQIMTDPKLGAAERTAKRTVFLARYMDSAKIRGKNRADNRTVFDDIILGKLDEGGIERQSKMRDPESEADNAKLAALQTRAKSRDVPVRTHSFLDATVHNAFEMAKRTSPDDAPLFDKIQRATSILYNKILRGEIPKAERRNIEIRFRDELEHELGEAPARKIWTKVLEAIHAEDAKTEQTAKAAQNQKKGARGLSSNVEKLITSRLKENTPQAFDAVFRAVRAHDNKYYELRHSTRTGDDINTEQRISELDAGLRLQLGELVKGDYRAVIAAVRKTDNAFGKGGPRKGLPLSSLSHEDASGLSAEERAALEVDLQQTTNEKGEDNSSIRGMSVREDMGPAPEAPSYVIPEEHSTRAYSGWQNPDFPDIGGEIGHVRHAVQQASQAEGMPSTAGEVRGKKSRGWGGKPSRQTGGYVEPGVVEATQHARMLVDQMNLPEETQRNAAYKQILKDQAEEIVKHALERAEVWRADLEKRGIDVQEKITNLLSEYATWKESTSEAQQNVDVQQAFDARKLLQDKYGLSERDAMAVEGIFWAAKKADILEMGDLSGFFRSFRYNFPAIRNQGSSHEQITPLDVSEAVLSDKAKMNRMQKGEKGVSEGDKIIPEQGYLPVTFAGQRGLQYLDITPLMRKAVARTRNRTESIEGERGPLGESSRWNPDEPFNATLHDERGNVNVEYMTALRTGLSNLITSLHSPKMTDVKISPFTIELLTDPNTLLIRGSRETGTTMTVGGKKVAKTIAPNTMQGNIYVRDIIGQTSDPLLKSGKGTDHVPRFATRDEPAKSGIIKPEKPGEAQAQTNTLNEGRAPGFLNNAGERVTIDTVKLVQAMARKHGYDLGKTPSRAALIYLLRDGIYSLGKENFITTADGKKPVLYRTVTGTDGKKTLIWAPEFTQMGANRGPLVFERRVFTGKDVLEHPDLEAGLTFDKYKTEPVVLTNKDLSSPYLYDRGILESGAETIVKLEALHGVMEGEMRDRRTGQPFVIGAEKAASLENTLDQIKGYKAKWEEQYEALKKTVDPAERKRLEAKATHYNELLHELEHDVTELRKEGVIVPREGMEFNLRKLEKELATLEAQQASPARATDVQAIAEQKRLRDDIRAKKRAIQRARDEDLESQRTRDTNVPVERTNFAEVPSTELQAKMDNLFKATMDLFGGNEAEPFVPTSAEVGAAPALTAEQAISVRGARANKEALATLPVEDHAALRAATPERTERITTPREQGAVELTPEGYQAVREHVEQMPVKPLEQLEQSVRQALGETPRAATATERGEAVKAAAADRYVPPVTKKAEPVITQPEVSQRGTAENLRLSAKAALERARKVRESDQRRMQEQADRFDNEGKLFKDMHSLFVKDKQGNFTEESVKDVKEVHKFFERMFGDKYDMTVRDILYASDGVTEIPGSFNPKVLSPAQRMMIQLGHMGQSAGFLMTNMFHESTHLLAAILRNSGAHGEKAWAQLEKGLNTPMMHDRIERVLKANGLNEARIKAIMEDIRTKPEEAAAYGLSLWAMKALKVGPETEGVFRRMMNFFMRVMRLTTEATRTEAFMKAFVTGELGRADFKPSALAEAFGEKAGDRVMQNIKDATQPLLTLTREVFDSSVQALDRLGPLGKELNILYAGYGPEEGYVHHTTVNQRRFATQLQRVMDGHTSKEIQAGMEEVLNRSVSSEAGKKLKQIIAEVNKYAGRSEGYIPTIWDYDKIGKNHQAFKDALRDFGDVDSSKKINNQAIIDTLQQMGYTDYSTKDRFDFKPQYAGEKAKWIQTDYKRFMRSFIVQTVNRVEKGKIALKVADVMRRIEHDLGEDGRATAQRVVDGYEGKLGQNMNPGVRKMVHALLTVGNVVTLPLALFSATVDPFHIMSRSGSLQAAGEAYARGIGSIPKTISEMFGGKVRTDEMTRFAEDVGAIEHSMFTDLLGDVYLGDHAESTTKKVNDWFFRANMLDGWTRQMRVAAVAAGQRFILAHAKGSKETGHKWSDHYLEELGLKPSDIVKRADGNLDISNPKLRMAINKFVDESVVRPDATTNAVWMNDPRFALVAHMKRFTYAFNDKVLNRAVDEMGRGNASPLLPLMASIPAILMADMGKHLLKMDFSTWMNGASVGDWVGYGAERAGLAGKFQFGLDAGYDVKAGGTPVDSFLGPEFGLLKKVMGQTRGSGQGELGLLGLADDAYFTYRALAAGKAYKARSSDNLAKTLLTP